MRSASFNLPIICVGNVAMGGTGKSPMVEYLIELLKGQFSVAVVSRGYKRKTKGYVLANENSTALEIGDEPMQFHTRFPDVPVAVGEERIVAIPQLLHDKPGIGAIILDDAIQHRDIKAGFNILLTVYNDLFVDDFFFPTGDLRDQKLSAKRADIIVVTKCPVTLSLSEKEKIIKRLTIYCPTIFFTTIEYGVPYHIITKNTMPLNAKAEILLVYGVANPKALKSYIAENTSTYEEMSFSDHHIFSIDDLKDITKKFKKMTAGNKFILTTEKDAVRLLKFNLELKDMPIYVLPIKPAFLFNETVKFNNTITGFIQNFHIRTTE